MLNTEVSRDLGRLETAPQLARLWLTSRMDQLGIADRLSGDARERVRLMASELVTNVVLHTRSSNAVITLRIGPTSVTVTVADDADQLPKLCHERTVLDGSGRGLRIVEALSAEWGVDRVRQGGKRVWFMVAFDLGFHPSRTAFRQ